VRHVAQGLDEAGEGHGLRHEGARAEVVGGHDVGLVLRGRQDDHRDAAQHWVGAQVGEHLAAVLAGHVEVEQDDVRRLRAGAAQVLEQRLAVGHAAQLRPARGLGERLGGELAVVLVVVGEQDDGLAVRHGAPWGSAGGGR
jgi:hypothetical protein